MGQAHAELQRRDERILRLDLLSEGQREEAAKAAEAAALGAEEAHVVHTHTHSLTHSLTHTHTQTTHTHTHTHTHTQHTHTYRW